MRRWQHTGKPRVVWLTVRAIAECDAPSEVGSMSSQLRVMALAATAVLVAGCLGASSPGPSPSRSPSGVSAVPTSTPVASTGPSPATAPIPTRTPNPTAPSPVTGKRCAPPATVQVLGGWTPAWPLHLLADCFGNRDLEVTGYLAPASGIGGLGNGVVPAWLGEWSGLPDVLWLKPHPADGCSAADDCIWMFLFAPNAPAVPLTPDRWVTLTGHFDDPAALTCRATGTGPDAVTSDAEAIVQCREHFVMTKIRTVASPNP